MKKKAAVVWSIALLVSTIVILSLYFVPLPDVRAQARRAVTEAYELAASIGEFESEDGTTASLTEDEINDRILTFNRKADACLSDDFTAKEYYKWLNEDYLTRTYRNTVDYIVKSGVADVQTPVILYDLTREQIIVRGRLIGWNIWIAETDGKFRISCDYNRMPLDVRLKREDGIFKVAVYRGISGEPENIGDTGIIAEAEKKSEKGKLSEEKEKILANIRRTDEICEQEYDTFSEALQAAEQIEFSDFNGYALE